VYGDFICKLRLSSQKYGSNFVQCPQLTIFIKQKTHRSEFSAGGL
jgi:hypothetical protein